MQQKVEISMHNNITTHPKKITTVKDYRGIESAKDNLHSTISLQLSGFSLFSRYHTVLNSQNKTKLLYLLIKLHLISRQRWYPTWRHSSLLICSNWTRVRQKNGSKMLSSNTDVFSVVHPDFVHSIGGLLSISSYEIFGPNGDNFGRPFATVSAL